MIFSAFSKALSQLSDPRFRIVLLKAIFLTVAVLFAFAALVVWGTGWLVGDSLTLPWIGEITWIDTVLSWAMVPLMMVLSVFLMVPVASAVSGLFLDEVAQAVEDRHMPHLGAPTPVGVVDGLMEALGFFGTLVLANLVALVLYIFLAPLAPFIFWGLNGFLLGREYFILAAMRRVGRPEARRRFRRNIGTIWAGGVLMALPLSVPLVNLLVPVLGAATFTHIFHRLALRDGETRTG